MLKFTSEGWHIFTSPVGPVGMAWNRRGVCRVVFGDLEPAAIAAELEAACPGLAEVKRPSGEVVATRGRIRDLLRGKADDLRNIPVDLSGCSEFSRQVLRTLRPTETSRLT